jgi:inner membrane protein
VSTRGLARSEASPDVPHVDPVTHTLTGAALSRAGLNRATPLATATLVLAANVPDIDIVVSVSGSYAALAHRRGVTHGPIALLLLPLLVTGLVLAYDRWWRRRRQADRPAARPRPVLVLAFLGTLTHPVLDWMNTYGIRLLMPFTDRWFYGDALFIIDPWVWLLLAAPLVGVYGSTRRGRILWLMLGGLATVLIMAAPQVPLAAQVLWLAAVAALVLAVMRLRLLERTPTERAARVALAAVVVYIGGMVGLDRAARAETRRAAEAAGMDVQRLMVAPAPANPLAADIVVETASHYQLGRFDWTARPRVRFDGAIPLGERTAAVFQTLQLQEVRDFLRWSRFPFVEVTETPTGQRVRFGDARYPGGMRGGLSGIVVDIERDMPARLVP